MRADVIHLILRKAVVDGEHLIWPSCNYSVRLNNRYYSIKAVLRHEEDLGLSYKNTCGVSRCIYSKHNEPRQRTRTRNFRECAFCGRKTRPWGVKKAEAPGTVASAGSGLCQSCYKAGYGYIGSDYGVEPLTEEQAGTVRRTVPRDLWSYFDVT